MRGRMRAAPTLLTIAGLAALGVGCPLLDWDYGVDGGGGGASSASSASSAGGGTSSAGGGAGAGQGAVWPDSATPFCSDMMMEVSCPTDLSAAHHGQDGDYLRHVPGYALGNDPADPTIADSITGLVWEADFATIAKTQSSW